KDTGQRHRVIPGRERSERTRNPAMNSECAYGFRVRAFGAPRNDSGESDGRNSGCHTRGKSKAKNSREDGMPTLRTLLLAAFGALLSCVSARAEYPDKQITMVVCFPAGGGTDIAARLVNVPLGEALGKPVVIENRGGAGGNIAIAAVKRLPADGYT